MKKLFYVFFVFRLVIFFILFLHVIFTKHLNSFFSLDGYWHGWWLAFYPYPIDSSG